MRGTIRPLSIAASLACLALCGGPGRAAEPISYQGLLSESGQFADGAYDFVFELYDDPSAGGLLGAASVDDVQVTGGLFSVNIDFGSILRPRDARWLQILVRPAGSADPFQPLAPRQFLAAAPFAAIDLSEPWLEGGSGALTFGADSGDEIVLINRNFRIGQEYFGIGADTAGFAGMYAYTSGDTGSPFYGYSAGGDVDAYTWYSGATQELRTWVNGSARMSIGSDGVTVLGDLTADDFVYADADGVSRTETVLGSEFVPEFSGSGAITHFIDSNLTSGQGGNTLIASVELPPGAIVRGMEVFVNDQTGIRGIEVRLLRRNLGSTAGSSAALVASYATNAPGLFTPAQPGFAISQSSTPVGIDDAVFLTATAFGSTGWPGSEILAIRGVRVNYTVTGPD